MPRVIIAAKGIAPWVRDRATYPLLAIIGCASGYVAYTMGKYLMYSPDVMLARDFRSLPTPEKNELRPDLGTNWHKLHQARYRHHEDPINQISVVEHLRSGFRERQAAAQANPDALTASGRSTLH